MHPKVGDLLTKHFGGDEHPYRTLEREIQARLKPDFALLDGGCGRTAPVLRKFAGRARRLVGIELVDFTEQVPGIELYKRDLSDTGLESGSFDLVYSRSVMEHVADPRAVFGETRRVLAPGGTWIFLTANKWDYASIAARLIPNRWHPAIVRKTEGREEEDTFPTQYKVNDARTIHALARDHGLIVEELRYLGQYPNYFLFSPTLFRIGTTYELFLRRHPSLHWLRGWILAILRKPPLNPPPAP